MVGRLQDTGLDTYLNDKVKDDIDSYLLQALQTGAGGGINWQARFDKYINGVLEAGLKGEKDDEILAILEKIAQNTEQKEELFKHEDLWTWITNTYGSDVAARWKASLNRQ